MLRQKSTKRASPRHAKKHRKPHTKTTRKMSTKRSLPQEILDLQVKPVNQQQTTLFGSYGQVGKYVAQYLGPTGMRMIAPYRDAGHNIRDIKVTGDVGQVAPLYFDWKDAASVAKTVEGSDMVINTIGSFENTQHFNTYDANARTALKLAKTAKEAGVTRFIHVSAAGASESSHSDFLKAKWESEQMVKTYFPHASIVRPCFTYDVNNNYMVRMAMLAAQPGIKTKMLIGGSQTRVQPTYARDVGAAIAQIAMHPHIDGQIWTLGGEQTITRGELFRMLLSMVGANDSLEHQTRELVELDAVPTAIQHLKEEHFSFKRQLNRVTQVGDLEYFLQDITLDTVTSTKGFEQLGIKPTSMDMTLVRLAQPHMLPSAPTLQEKLFGFKTGGIDANTPIRA